MDLEKYYLSTIYKVRDLDFGELVMIMSALEDAFKGKHTSSTVARAFPVGRVAHPEGQNEGENEKILRKNKSN